MTIRLSLIDVHRGPWVYGYQILGKFSIQREMYSVNLCELALNYSENT